MRLVAASYKRWLTTMQLSGRDFALESHADVFEFIALKGEMHLKLQR